MATLKDSRPNSVKNNSLQWYSIYRHINRINGKQYVGITKNKPQERWGSNGINYRQCRLFYNAILKYGWDNFEHEIIMTGLTEEQAVALERMFIQLCSSMVPNGYNLTNGGEIKKEISEKTRNRLRTSHLGYKCSEETKKKMSKSRMGHTPYLVRPVWMCDKKTHEKIKLFSSIFEAETFLHHTYTRTHIGHVCKKERPSACGYFWEYAQEGRDDLSLA